MAPKEPEIGGIFFGILFLSILMNSLFIIVILCRRRLRKGHYGLLLSLCVLDISCFSVWAGLTGAVLGLGWDIPGEACRLQSYLLTFIQTLTAMTLATVSLERLLAMMKPSRHARVFVPKVVVFLVIALWVFCGILASIHFYGNIPVSWQSNQRQCAAEFTENIKMLDFTFCFDHAIPYWVISLPAMLVAFLKVFLSRRRAPATGEITLEHNPDAAGDSYSARLNTVQSKFSSNHSKLHSAKQRRAAKKPTLGKREFTPQGFTEPEQWDSDIEDGQELTSDTEPIKLRLYFLPRTEYIMLRASAAAIFVTWLLWFPWVIARFIWNKTPFESRPSGFDEFVVICLHLSTVAKPIVYTVFNPHFRHALLKTIRCCR